MIHIALCVVAAAFTACMDDTAEPPVSKDNGVTSQVSLGKANTTIAQAKTKHSGVMSSTNLYEEVTADEILEGIVVANDVSGNLYQTIILRDVSDAANDQCIQVGIRNTHVSSFFPLGQGVRINMKGLYIGNYSAVPKIGQPYKTSSGNLRLGPMLFNLLRTNVELFTASSALQKKALTPITVDETWLGAHANAASVPALVTVEGTLTEADGEAIFAPDNLKDAGYAVNRELQLTNSTAKISVRTSTQNEISFTIMPTGKVQLTGILTYYPQGSSADWQLQLRDLNDLKALE